MACLAECTPMYATVENTSSLLQNAMYIVRALENPFLYFLSFIILISNQLVITSIRSRKPLGLSPCFSRYEKRCFSHVFFSLGLSTSRVGCEVSHRQLKWPRAKQKILKGTERAFFLIPVAKITPKFQSALLSSSVLL